MNIFQTIANWFSPRWTNDNVTAFEGDIIDHGYDQYSEQEHINQLRGRLSSGYCNEYQKFLVKQKLTELEHTVRCRKLREEQCAAEALRTAKRDQVVINDKRPKPSVTTKPRRDLYIDLDDDLPLRSSSSHLTSSSSYGSGSSPSSHHSSSHSHSGSHSHSCSSSSDSGSSSSDSGGGGCD